MTDYFCRVCGYLWAALGESLWCPKCETDDIQRSDEEITDEPVSKS